jgi:scyllo-inositol 2-dehydrogenase (NADP+)
VGYGIGVSLYHAPFIDAVPELDQVAVVTTDTDRRAAARRRHPGTDILGSVELRGSRLVAADVLAPLGLS